MESIVATGGAQVGATIEADAGARLARRSGVRIVLRMLLVALIADAAVLGWVLRNPSARLVLEYRAPPERWIVPVAGVRAQDLRSTWQAPRPGGRKHRGVDIFAAKGTPVVAATDGVVMKIGRDRLGGNVVWMLGEGLQVHYYAHLDAWEPGLQAGDRVRAGEPLGTVGNTGNAATTPAHLHFALSQASLKHLRRIAYDPVTVLRAADTRP